jgi:hypothetical protein
VPLLIYLQVPLNISYQSIYRCLLISPTNLFIGASFDLADLEEAEHDGVERGGGEGAALGGGDALKVRIVDPLRVIL